MVIHLLPPDADGKASSLVSILSPAYPTLHLLSSHWDAVPFYFPQDDCTCYNTDAGSRTSLPGFNPGPAMHCLGDWVTSVSHFYKLDIPVTTKNSASFKGLQGEVDSVSSTQRRAAPRNPLHDYELLILLTMIILLLLLLLSFLHIHLFKHNWPAFKMVYR